MERGSGRLILIAGATGYVGGRLLAALEARGEHLRCLARRPEALAWKAAPRTEVVRGDCLDPASLTPALEGVDTAYYLVHSMGAGPGFAALDRQAAANFASAARASGVRRIVYLGGLGSEEDGLSKHLRSRQETGDLLRAEGVDVVELRASIVIGSGSLSYEMVRALVERLPVMVCPRWVRVKTQPIGIEDLIAYLVAACDLPGSGSRVYEIGGPDVVTYGEIMAEYARQRGLKRALIPVPFLTPRLSSLWLGLVTPLYARVGRELIGSLRNATLVRSDAAVRDFPALRARPLREAIARAASLEDAELGSTRWCDAAAASGLPEKSWGGVRLGSRIVDSRSLVVEAEAGEAFAPIRRIGGATGWYSANGLWRVRGAIDLVAGGVGLRRGRRDPERLHPGEALDFWRVEAVEENRLLRLAAEMKMPGRAWLQFEVEPLGAGRSEIRQTALFDPRGLLGLAYWYLLYPLHAWIFRGMLREIGRRSRSPLSHGSDLKYER
ncbi:MAG: SDR family oxidoreductase [Acidobacteriota bacterium]